MIRFLIVFFIFSQNAVPGDLLKMRQLYEQLNKNESAALSLKQITENSTSLSVPLKQAYLAVSNMALSQYKNNPATKWKAFQEGKKVLEKSISADTSIIELRYIRLTIQQHAPSLLGYTSNIKNDRLFLITHVSLLKKTDPDLFARVYTYLLLKEKPNDYEKGLMNAKV